MTTSLTFRKLALVSVSLIGLIGFAETASAKTFTPKDPRQVEVNQRLHNERLRIATDLRTGKIGGAKASRLLRKEIQIRREERVMASLNHGRLTKAEQKALNQQENRLDKRIP